MKVSQEACEAVLSSPASLSRSRSSWEDMAGGSLYSPTLKASRSEALSRVHCIPLLMLLVFFVLWAASSEVKPDARMAATASSEEDVKVIDEESALRGRRAMLFQEEAFHSRRADPPLRNTERGQRFYIRGKSRY